MTSPALLLQIESKKYCLLQTTKQNQIIDVVNSNTYFMAKINK
jgi:hypothetical protein